MSKRNDKHLAALVRIAAALLAAAAVACGAPLPSIPVDGVTDLAVADAALAAEVTLAAEAWARAGLEVASLVTVNQEAAAAPVSLVTRAQLLVECHLDAASDADACTWYKAGHLHGVFVADDLTAARRAVVLRHELIHVLVPRAEHLPDSVPAVFSEHGHGASEPTAADVEQIGNFADVTIAHSWPTVTAAE